MAREFAAPRIDERGRKNCARNAILIYTRRLAARVTYSTRILVSVATYYTYALILYLRYI